MHTVLMTHDLLACRNLPEHPTSHITFSFAKRGLCRALKNKLLLLGLEEARTCTCPTESWFAQPRRPLWCSGHVP